MSLLLVCLVAAAAESAAFPAATLDFKAWMQEHHKAYPTAEEHARREAVFAANMADIARLNAEGGATFAMNQFGDMDAAEFAHTVLMPRRPAPAPATATRDASLDRPFLEATHRKPSAVHGSSSALPAEFDWRARNAVTPVRNQGQAGTCWAFSAVGAVESQRAIAGHGLEWLSVEQVVDCDNTTFPDKSSMDCGVNGGLPVLAFQYIRRTGGLMPDAAYGYCVGTGGCQPCPAVGYNASLCGAVKAGCRPDESCAARFHPQDIVPDSRVASVISVPQDEARMQAALVAHGPLSVGIDATAALQFYRSGVFRPAVCSKTHINHAVLIVGYGASAGVDYWIVKNSWGATWGEEGYFRLDRGHNTCGIDTNVVVPVLG